MWRNLLIVLSLVFCAGCKMCNSSLEELSLKHYISKNIPDSQTKAEALFLLESSGYKSSKNIEYFVKAEIPIIELVAYIEDCFSGDVSIEKITFVKKDSINNKLLSMKNLIICNDAIWNFLLSLSRNFAVDNALDRPLSTEASLVVLTTYKDKKLNRVIAVNPWEKISDGRLMLKDESSILNFLLLMISRSDYKKFFKRTCHNFESELYRPYSHLLLRLKKDNVNPIDAYNKLFTD